MTFRRDDPVRLIADPSQTGQFFMYHVHDSEKVVVFGLGGGLHASEIELVVEPPAPKRVHPLIEAELADRAEKYAAERAAVKARSDAAWRAK